MYSWRDPQHNASLYCMVAVEIRHQTLMLSAKSPGSKVTAEEICQMLRTLAPAESQKIDVDTDIVGTGLLDSVAMLELLLWLEEDKQIRIPEEDLLPENFRSVRVIHEFLLRLGER